MSAKLLVLGVVALASVSVSASAADDLRTPIIGVYSAPDAEGGDYIAASYFKWIEMAGGRGVPIPYHISDEHARGNVSALNGLVFPGGGAELPDQARYLFDYAMSLNRKGDYFPIWGTCLGFEWLMQLNGGKLDSGFDAENLTLPLSLESAAATSRLFKSATPQLMEIFKTKAVTMNNHNQGITMENFLQNAKLTSFFNVLSTNKDRKGVSFVSTVEAKEYPVYGTQWHPEKNQFEWGKTKAGIPNEVIDHSVEAIQAGAFPAFFLISEARKNNHKFPTPEAEAKALIWNYPVSYTTETSRSFVQEYKHLFKATTES